jgi:Asp/Glu/hydantoin racemase
MADQTGLLARIALINPNTSRAVTKAMVEIAQGVLPPGIEVKGLTAIAGPRTITRPDELARSAAEVIRLSQHAITSWDRPLALIVGAFGDPGLDQLRRHVPVPPAVPTGGVAEASIKEACRGGRRFGIATTTPALEAAIMQRVVAYGAAEFFTGFQFTTSDPLFLMTSEAQLREELGAAAQKCVTNDGADAVIIGGGPLAQAAAQLQTDLDVPLVVPVAAAARAMLHELQGSLLRF